MQILPGHACGSSVSDTNSNMNLPIGLSLSCGLDGRAELRIAIAPARTESALSNQIWYQWIYDTVRKRAE